jgi:UDP-perosamine 4-acetyltransferase
MIDVIGIGAGGHAKVMIEILLSAQEYEIIGLLDPKPALWNTKVLGIPVLGNDDLLPVLYQQGVRHAFIGLGTVGDAKPRIRLYNKAKRRGLSLVSVVYSQAMISPSAEIGEGVTIMPGAIVNAEAKVGANVIINTSAVIEHDCVIDRHVHIATGARLAGAVSVAEGAFVGAGATVKQGVTIGEHAIVGAGAVVIEDVPGNVTVVGVPAHVLRKREI